EPAHTDVYMWEIFGVDKIPFDGLLVSRITIENDKRKYLKAKTEGIHSALRLPKNIEILGDCGAFGYVKDKVPPFDPIEILTYYRDLGFTYGVSVDHLVVTQFEKEKNERMRITYKNGIKAYEEWSKNFRKDFDLFLAIQGWNVHDYVRMYRDYVDLGAEYLAFGGLARSPTSFITKLVEELIVEIKNSRKIPERLHFFGLARPALFPKFVELENLGISVSFDSASYLRKAWLSSPSSQLNYLVPEGRGYTAIRIPFVSRRTKSKTTPTESQDLIEMQKLEQECLDKLRGYDKGNADVEDILSTLSRLSSILGYGPDINNLYRRTLEDKPWKLCKCPVCKEIGIEVIIFRGNNRNRRRGFHNTYVFHNVTRNPQLWSNFMSKKEKTSVLSTIKKGDRVLVITECTKKKIGYTNSTKRVAKEMYQGRLFKLVKAYCQAMEFDYVIISAKHGLIFPNDVIEGYEKFLKTQEDIEIIRPQIEKKLREILGNYDKIVVIAGSKYRRTLRDLWDNRFEIVRSRGYGDLCKIIKNATPSVKSIMEYLG
ncbi:MAG: tRNA-guanine transglycosylase DpdA, partial [Candidatus Bathyarchaeia archaeon]